MTECQLHAGPQSRHWGDKGELEAYFKECNSKGGKQIINKQKE